MRISSNDHGDEGAQRRGGQELDQGSYVPLEHTS